MIYTWIMINDENKATTTKNKSQWCAVDFFFDFNHIERFNGPEKKYTNDK